MIDTTIITSTSVNALVTTDVSYCFYLSMQP